MIAAVFADLPSIYTAVKKKFQSKVDYGKILNHIQNDQLSNDTIIRAIAYSAQSENEALNFSFALKHLGYIPKFTNGKDFHVDFCLDVTMISNKIQKAVFITNDINYQSLFKWCKNAGIYVHLFCVQEHEFVDYDELTEITQKFLELNQDEITKTT